MYLCYSDMLMFLEEQHRGSRVNADINHPKLVSSKADIYPLYIWLPLLYH